MALDKKAFHNLSYGLFLITATGSGGQRSGCIVNTFQQVANEPPMASVALHKDNLTTQLVKESGCFGACVLTESADMQLIGRFGFKSGRDLDKFADMQCRVDEQEVAYINEHANAHFRVRVMHTLDLGSHYLFVGVVEDSQVICDEPSMTYAYYHSELRGKAPKNAVSYEGDGAGASAAGGSPEQAPSSRQAEGAGAGGAAGQLSDADGAQAGDGVDASADSLVTPETEAAAQADEGTPRYGWRCLICGFVIEQNELPDDYICPICGVGKDMFERFLLD